MALEIRLAVTQPYHGADGVLVCDVGDLLAPGDAPDGARGHLVVVEAEDRAPKAAKATEKPADRPASS